MATMILALLEEHENAAQVSACLEACGHKVFVVDTFVKAKGLLKSQNIDLIISDVHLVNGGNVFDFLRWAKGGAATSKIPFVLFSNKPTPTAKYLADGVRISARMLGAVKYLEMDEFDAVNFQKHINELLPPDKQTTNQTSTQS
jgi:CheY-like chemotaxis protein